jgi:hypothetical protein
MRHGRVGPVTLAAALMLVGCAVPDIVERPAQGPNAQEFFLARSYQVNGRSPSFDERRVWEDRLDDRIFRYLREHPEIQQSTRYSDFRFWRQVSAGSTPEEVRLLLEEPEERSIDPARLAVLAQQHWSSIQAKVKEGWVYSLTGWVIFFDDKGVVEMVRRVSGTAPRD